MCADSRLVLEGRWLEVHFREPQQVLSWAIVGGGARVARHVVWHYVRREELPEEVDPAELLRTRLRARGLGDAVGLLTARDLRGHVDLECTLGDLRARCVVTVGLGNALRSGDPAEHGGPPGTINALCWLSAPLSPLARLEALSLTVEARTAALLEVGFPSVVSGRPASGTGTDCHVFACPKGADERPYAGKHTQVGQLVGEVVERAVREATRAWLRDQGA